MIQKISTRDGFGKGLSDIDDENVVVLTADLAESCRLNGFKEKYPGRFIEVGISEQDMFGIANGLALEGKIPITNTFSIFCTRSYEQIRLICFNNSNVKIVGHHSGLTLGQDGGIHQTIEDIGMFRMLPRMTVIVPADAIEAQKAVYDMVRLQGPCYLRVSREPFPIITNEYSDFKIGKANIVREGTDILIVSCGTMVSESLRAAKMLSDEKIDAAVMNMHTIKPLDKEALLKYASKCRIVLTVEEHSVYAGLGSAVSEALSETRIPVRILGIQDSFGESGHAEELLQKYCLSAENIVANAKDLLKHKEHITQQVKEVNDIMREANSSATTYVESAVTQHVEPKPAASTISDPRGRIIRMKDSDKKKVDDVLYKMFGGRRT